MGRTSRTRLLFDRWSRTYDRPELQLLTYRPLHDAVLGRLQRTEPAVVVDLGCGTGRLTDRLVQRFPGADVVGIDMSMGMLEVAADRVAVPLARADAHELPLAPGSVDVVVCTESFHWYRDQGLVLDGLARLLRPGGRLLIGSIAALTGVGDRFARVVTSCTASAPNSPLRPRSVAGPHRRTTPLSLIPSRRGAIRTATAGRRADPRRSADLGGGAAA